MRGLSLAAIAVAFVSACTNPAPKAEASSQKQDTVDTAREPTIRIRITTSDRSFTAVLEDNQTARDFASLLPIEVALDDYNKTEKVADLPRPLTIVGAPAGADPVVGDVAYYAPWGSLAIYYRDFAYSDGLVRLGHLEGDVSTLPGIEPGAARIEIIPND